MSYVNLVESRVSGLSHIGPILNLCKKVVTAIFPRSAEAKIISEFLQRLWDPQFALVELAWSYSPDLKYGYGSRLNRTSDGDGDELAFMVGFPTGGAVLDVCSSDSTSLSAYDFHGLQQKRIRPSGLKFKAAYPDDVIPVSDFLFDNYLLQDAFKRFLKFKNPEIYCNSQ